MTTSPRSPVGTELGTHEPQPETRYWLRTCNDVGATLVGYDVAVFCSQQPGAEGDLKTELTWRVWPTQDSRESWREFKLRPLTEAQAREWLVRYGRVAAT